MTTPHPEPNPEYRDDQVLLAHGDFLAVSAGWPAPTVVVMDGPYGLGSYPGDLPSTRGLAAWYEPHVARLNEAATPATTLWFWSTELAWATVHPVLERQGWVYHSANIWDKGLGHIAGNSNTQTLRRFPVVSELCVQYFRPTVVHKVEGQDLTIQDWLRAEWRRTGLPFRLANEACGVRNAATRKYLTSCDKWYMPPRAAYEGLVNYANQHGDPAGRPYFDQTDGDLPAPDYARMRGKFTCPIGVTNIWSEPTVSASQRIRTRDGAHHPNQKPQRLMELIITASSDPGDVVWEPFGGVCTAAVAAAATGRRCYSAELRADYHRAATRNFLRRSQLGRQLALL